MQREILAPISGVLNNIFLNLKISTETARKTVFYALEIFVNILK